MVHTTIITSATILTKQQQLQDKQITTHQPQPQSRYIALNRNNKMQTQKRTAPSTHNWRYQSGDNWNNNDIQHMYNNANIRSSTTTTTTTTTSSWRNKSMDASTNPEYDDDKEDVQRREGEGYEVTKKVLGRGANSIVLLGYEKRSFRKVAVKQIMVEKLSSVAKSKLQKEIEILNVISAASTSDRLLKILHVSSSLDNRIINIVTEYIPGSDLFELITSAKLPSLPSPSSSPSPPASTENNNNYGSGSGSGSGGHSCGGSGVAVVTTKGMNKTEFYTQILYSILEGVKELHDLEICHLDLKLENIMYNSQSNRIKIIDFGFSQFTSHFHPPRHHYSEIDCNNNNNDHHHHHHHGGRREERRQVLQTTYCGSVHYAAPELLKRQPFDGKKADIWSLGVMAYAMFAGKFPFDSKDGRTSSVFEKIRSSEIRFPAHFPSPLCDLLSLMMQRNPSSRCSIDAILSHPFFSTYNVIAA